MSPLYFQSAQQMAQAIATKQVSSYELLQAHLERIDQVNPAISALVTPNPQALQQAKAADQALAKGEVWGPLHGVPFSVKDWIDAAGLRCAGADMAHYNRIAPQDATAVARLRQAGGILLGKTAVLAESEIYGTVHNPYRWGYSPTGSSSGEAALIAAGASPLGLGSDSGGSIRQPAHACGIAGLKPTSGRVSLHGHFPPISALNDPRTVIGPMARYVSDLALALPIISGPDYRDASVIPMAIGNYEAVDLTKLRVAFYTQHLRAQPTPETVAAVHKTAQALSQVCLSVEEKLPPRIEEAYPITWDYWNRVESDDLDEWKISRPSQLSGDEVARHLFEWNRFRNSLIAFMEHHDLIVCPVADLPAQKHGESTGGIAFTLVYSLCGYPAATVRVGTSPQGLPIGVQLVAAPWREDIVLAAAAFVEQLGGWQPPRLSE